jgi:hypothetical protein
MNRFTAALMILVMGVFYMTERAYPAGGDRDIFRYASEGNIPQIKISVEKGDRPDALDSCGRRPADLALQAGRKDAVEFLQSLKILTYPSGSLYIGQMKNGMEHGWGVYRCFNGSLYSGEFDNGRFQGLGQWRYADGSRYSGRFERDIFSGRNVHFADSDIYSKDLYGETLL